MRKTTIILIIALIMVFSLTALVGAQVSPRPGVGFGFGFGPTVPLSLAPAFTPIGFPAITPCTTTVKLTLSKAEQTALRNLRVGKWHVVRFCFPAAYAGQRLIWTSSNPNVAIADGQASWGLVLGVGPGTTTITVRTTDGSFSYSFQVVVR